jgi:hypothetical protein
MRVFDSWRHSLIVIGVMAACSICALPIQATPVQFGSHSYEFVLVSDPYAGTNNSWFSASAAASASMFGGVNGYLATITSQAENDFLYSLVNASLLPPNTAYPGFNGAWIGGHSEVGWLTGWTSIHIYELGRS